MKIAIVVDGLEATRQFHADSGTEIERACMQAMLGHPNFSVRIYRDDQVADLFASLAHSDVAAIIFASNSVRHPEGKVVQNLSSSAHKDNISRFLKAGGGLAILHQYFEGDIPIKLPNSGSIRFVTRKQNLTTQPFQYPRDARTSDPLLNFPIPIRDLDQELSKDGQLGEVISWMAIDQDSESLTWLEPTIKSATNETLLAKSSDAFPWRVVLSAIPLDWHRSTNLLVNIVRFVAAGKPETLIWPGDDLVKPAPLSQALTQSPSTFVMNTIPSLAPADHWVYTLPALHLLSDETQNFSAENERKITESGGLILKVQIDPKHNKTSFSGVIGSRRMEFVEDYFRTLSAAWPGAPRTSDPFPLRNIVLASRFFAEEHPSLGYLWDPKRDTEFNLHLDRLLVPRITITTAYAVMQTMAASHAPAHHLIKARTILENFKASGRAELALFEASSVAVGKSSFKDFLEKVAIISEDPGEFQPELALRILDWLGFLYFTMGLRVDDSAPLRDSLKNLLKIAKKCEVDGIWLSLEGTTSAVLGACALVSVTNDITLLNNVLSGVMALRAADQARSMRPEEVAIEIRVLHALAVVEAFAPFVLDQMEARLRLSASHLGHEKGAQESIRDAKSSSQIAIRNSELKNELSSLKSQHPVLVVGALTLWILYLTLLISLGVVITLIGSISVSWISWLVALLALGWLYVAFLLLLKLERLRLVPRWLTKSIRRVGRFSKWFPESVIPSEQQSTK